MQPIAKEIVRLAKLTTGFCGDFKHAPVGAKLEVNTGDAQTVLEYRVPDNLAWVVTAICIRSVPAINDADLGPRDWRAGDIDATGGASLFVKVYQADKTNPTATGFAIANRPILLGFNGGSVVEFILDRSDSTKPATEVFEVSINGYLAPQSILDCIGFDSSVDTSEPDPSPIVTCLGAECAPALTGPGVATSNALMGSWFNAAETLLFFVNRNLSRVERWDTTNKALPALESSLAIANQAGGNYLNGNILYVVSETDRKLHAIDVSTSPPTELGQVVIAAGGTMVARTRAVAYSANRVYVSRIAGFADFRIDIIDVSNPAAMVVLGSFNTNAGWAVNQNGATGGLFAVGNTVYSIDEPSGFGVNSRLAVFDTTNALAVTQDGAMVLATIQAFSGVPDIIVSSNTAYLYIANIVNGIWIIDVTNPAPALLSNIFGVGFIRLGIQNNTLYASSGNANTLNLYNVTNKLLPSLCRSVPINDGGDLSVSSDFAYLVEPSLIQIVSCSDCQ